MHGKKFCLVVSCCLFPWVVSMFDDPDWAYQETMRCAEIVCIFFHQLYELSCEKTGASGDVTVCVLLLFCSCAVMGVLKGSVDKHRSLCCVIGSDLKPFIVACTARRTLAW